MGTFTLVLIIVLVLLAIGLLFPFVFWVEFHAGKTGAEVKLFLFKRLLWTYEKVWKEEEPETKSEAKPEPEETPPAEQKAETEEKESPKPVVAEAPQAKPEVESKKEAKEESKEESPANSKAESKAEPQVKPKEEPEAEPQEEKKSLTEREFWTLLLTPDFDERGLDYAKKILSRFMTVFRVSFVDCYVEGIRMDYKSMGYGAAANAMMKGYPYLEDWDIRMDWTRDHELQAAGKVRASVNLCRTFWFLFVSSVRIGVMALIFWRRRAAVLKTGQLPELGYVRKKVLDWLVEE
jgi:hypothetical protein